MITQFGQQWELTIGSRRIPTENGCFASTPAALDSIFRSVGRHRQDFKGR
jgi:hypothetical protein